MHHQHINTLDLKAETETINPKLTSGKEIYLKSKADEADRLRKRNKMR